MDIKELEEEFMKSNWPKTDKILSDVVKLPYEEAKEIFIKGLKAKRHGIRTASIKGLVSFNRAETVDIIRPFLGDPSYETRIEAKNAIIKITGEDVKTSKGE